MSSSTTTSPASVDVTTVDDPLPLVCDATGLLVAGETVTGVATSLTNVATGKAVTLSTPPTFTSSSATQAIVGSSLVAGQRYRLIWTFQLSSGIELGQATVLNVDY